MTALFLLTPFRVSADDYHVIIMDDSDLISVEKISELNEDLHRIEENYDVSIYFIYDTSISDSEDAVIKYAQSFLDSHSTSTNNVALVLAQHYYRVEAKGPQADKIKANEDELWNAFYGKANSNIQDGFAEGIRSFYQLALRLINEDTYTSSSPTVRGTPLVNDYADLLSDKEEENLYVKLRKVSDKYDIDAVVVTTNSTNGKSIEDYADDFYDYNGYKEDGVMFVIDMNEHEVYVQTSGKCISYVTDYGIDVIFDDMWSDLTNGRYYDAFVIFAKDADSIMKSGESGHIVDVDSRPADSFGIKNVVISAIAGAVASLFTSLIMKSKMKTVANKYYAGEYIQDNSLVLTGASDMLVNRHVSRSPIRREEARVVNSHSGSSSSGGSHIHTSSSGSSHGGHGRHF